MLFLTASPMTRTNLTGIRTRSEQTRLTIQETHHKMTITELGVTYIVLSVYLLTLTSPIRHKMDHTQVNWLQLKTSELELDFAEYIQCTNVRIADLFWAPTIYWVMSHLWLLALSILTCSPNNELPTSTRFGQFQKFGNFELGTLSSPATPKETLSARGLSSCPWLPARLIWHS